ncbi:MAG: tetratricopeptide repeat protein [Bdellovibrionia bacterium]
MKIVTLVLLVVHLTSCAHLNELFTDRKSDAEKSQPSAQELAFFERGEKELKERNFEEAQKTFREFYEKNPSSSLLNLAILGEADALHQLGQSQEALSRLTQLRDRSITRNPSFAALASYRMSFIYEDLGDVEKTLAALVEAESQKRHLSPLVVHAEIPARKARNYLKMGASSEARRWVEQANRGVEYLRSHYKSKNDDWLAEVYFNMGKISSQSQLDLTWEQRMESYHLAYPFLYKSVLQNVEPWSENSMQALLFIYQDMSRLLYENVPGTKKLRADRNKASLLKVELDTARRYRPLNPETAHMNLKALFKVEDTLYKTVNDIVYSGISDMELTPESEKRSTILRGYRLVNPEQEREALPGQDPNL